MRELARCVPLKPKAFHCGEPRLCGMKPASQPRPAGVVLESRSSPRSQAEGLVESQSSRNREDDSVSAEAFHAMEEKTETQKGYNRCRRSGVRRKLL